jgi:formamidopyrimidine-DNA glycosylase
VDLMPELPDVEVLRQYVDATSLHQTIEAVAIDAPRMLKHTATKTVRSWLEGADLAATRRHGKHLLVKTSRGPWLVLHFGMTGRLDYAKRDHDPPRHARLLIDFSNGYWLAGIWQQCLAEIGLACDVGGFVKERELGTDALELDLPEFKDLLARRRGAIKSALMDQKLFAGIGNVYSDEILFQARLHPGRDVRRLDETDLTGLHRAVRHVLRLAIERRADPEQVLGSWLLPHRSPDESCPRCSGHIERATIGGRSAYYCPRCQK